jgi:hypothetical protein
MTDPDNREPGGEIPPGSSTEMQSDEMPRRAEFWMLSLAAVMNSATATESSDGAGFSTRQGVRVMSRSAAWILPSWLQRDEGKWYQ